MALGGVLVLAALIGGFALLVGGDDDGDSAQSAAERSGLTERLTKRDAGLSVFYPEDWKRSERGGIVNLESADRCIVVSLSTPVPASLSKRIFRDAIEAVQRSYRGAQVRLQRQAPPIGGAPTAGAVAGVPRKNGDPVVVRISVSRGRQLAHVLQTVARGNCPETVTQSQAIVDSIEYTR